MVLEVEERATLVLDENEDDVRLLVNGTLVEDAADVACLAKIGFVQRELLRSPDVDDQERYEPEELELDDDVRCGGHGSGAGLPGTAGAVRAGLPCGTQVCRGGVTA